jgi:hypothetical protein
MALAPNQFYQDRSPDNTYGFLGEELGLKNGHRLHTFTAAELMAEELPPVREVVPGLVPEGVTLFVGKPKMRKTLTALGLCIAISTGGVAFGKIPVERGEALYLALEDNKRRIQKRLRAMLPSGADLSGFHLALDSPRLDEGGVEALAEKLVAHPDLRLVVVDTLAKVRPRAPGRNVYLEDYAALEGLLPLAAEHRVAIVVIHHLRKMAAADPLDEISGSTGLSGGVDGVMLLKRDRGRADAFLYVDGRDIEEPRELALRWDAELASWSLVGDAEEYRVSQERQDIIRVLEDAGEPMAPKEVAELLDKAPNTVKYLMWRMSKDAQLEAVGKGRYSLTTNPANPLTHDSVSAVSEVSGNAPLTINEQREVEF